MKILNVEPDRYSRVAYAKLLELGEVVEIECDRDRLLLEIVDVDILIVRLANFIDSHVINKASRLKVIVTATTGLNHIDIDAAKKKGITVLSLKGERIFLDSLTATAELTWGILLSLIRNLPSASQSVSTGVWSRDQFWGTQLQNKTLGILGFGRLGSIVAQYAQAFRMKIIACDPNINKFPSNVRSVNFKSLLKDSDIISLHVNLDASTRGLLDKNAISAIKPGAIIVNTSRGELIDESALVDSLLQGHIAGVAVDVLNGEVSHSKDWLINNPLWKYAQEHNNVIIMPHIGGATNETMEDTELFMVDKLKQHLASAKNSI